MSGQGHKGLLHIQRILLEYHIDLQMLISDPIYKKYYLCYPKLFDASLWDNDKKYN